MPTDDASSGNTSSSNNPSNSASSEHASSEGPELIYFEGPWSAEEKETVVRAARTAEANGLPGVPAEAGRPWVATKHVFQTFNLLTASRARVPGVLVAQGATALATEIEGGDEADEDRGDAADEGARRVHTTGDRSIFQLMYRSEATGPMDGEALRDLIRHSRDNNHRLGVTGVLLYKADGFLQVLEGDEETVRGLYATIREDPRHEAVETIMTVRARHRAFPEWSMGLEDLERGPDAMPPSEPGVTSFLETGRLPTDRDPPPDVARALEQFRERGGAAR